MWAKSIILVLDTAKQKNSVIFNFGDSNTDTKGMLMGYASHNNHPSSIRVQSPRLNITCIATVIDEVRPSSRLVRVHVLSPEDLFQREGAGGETL